MMRFTIGILLSLLLATGGCVERTLTVQSNPPGALVYLNDQEVGRTPVQRDFKWYGVYEVVIRKEGYVPIKTQTPVIAPWYEWVPFDLVAELIPLKIKVRPQLNYDLEPENPQPGDADALIRRGEEGRTELENGQYTHVVRPRATSPSTRPTTLPTTLP
jgi:hypothetical protein